MLVNKKITISRAIFPILLILSFTGCGGGGGGAPQDLVYSGNTNSAVITLENAATLVGNVLYGGDAGANIPAAVMLTEETNLRSAGAVVQSTLLHSISQSVQDSILNNNASLLGLAVGVVLNEPLECDSGSGNIAGTLNDSTFTGTLTVTYSNCLLDDVTYNGTVSFRIDAFDLNYFEITDATITFSLLSISSPEFTGSMGGTIRIQSMIVSNTEKMTLNYVFKDNLTGKMYKFENMIHTTVYDYIFFPSNKTITVTGTPARAFDSLHGYVDVDTLTPLSFSSDMIDYPDVGGVMLFKGASGASIKLTVLSGKLIQLELDIDGALGYEVLRILLWDELNVNTETNISDTDNDGMHDSWELDNNFNPQDAADATQDADGDGFSNIEEYQSGTDPNDISSFPPSADLSITKTDSVDPVAANTTFDYKLVVNNSGPDTAINVQVQDTLPSGMSFVSASGTGWSCNNWSGTVSCTYSSLGIGVAPVITIVVDAPSASGNISNTASVSSSAVDSNNSNDNAMEPTYVAPVATSNNLNLGAPAFDMEIDATRNLLYVSIPTQNEIVLVSLDTFTILSRVVVGPSPHGIDLSKDGNILYIALNQSGSVAMLDLNTMLVSEVVVAVELDTSLTYDVVAATSTEVFASGNPGSSGFAYIVKIDTANSNLVTRVASNRIIRADPFFVASADQQDLYVGEGFSPNSVYKLDLTQNDAPIVLEDNHGDIIYGGNKHLAINPDGSRLYLASGQVLNTNTLTQAGLIGSGVSTVSTDGAKVYIGTPPNSISVYNTSTFLETDNIFTTCDIASIERIIELEASTESILLGQQTVCRVDLNSVP